MDCGNFSLENEKICEANKGHILKVHNRQSICTF